MTFGFIATGDSGQVQVNDTQTTLATIHKGTFNRAGGSSFSVTYPSPVLTQAAPVVFARPDGPLMFSGFNHTGSPGNWTGFTCSVGIGWSGTPLPVNTGRWAVCALDYYPGSGAQFGMVVNDSAGRRVFDTGFRTPRFLSGGQTWNAISSASGGSSGGTVFRYRLPWNLPTSAYVMISGFKHYWGNVNLSDYASIGFAENNYNWVWATIRSFDSYPPYNFNWPMLAADFG